MRSIKKYWVVIRGVIVDGEGIPDEVKRFVSRVLCGLCVSIVLFRDGPNLHGKG